MAKGRFFSLRSKLILSVLLAVVLGVSLFAGSHSLGTYLINRLYLAPEAVQGRVLEHLVSLRSYVEERRISSTNAPEIAQFCREHRGCQLTIYGRDAVLTASESGAALTSYGGLTSNVYYSAEPEQRYPVNFSDSSFDVSITDHSEKWLNLMLTIGSLILGCSGFLLVLLLYNRMTTNQIRSLSRRVRQVSQGDLTLGISAKSHDEIGLLAEDVNAMRLSIIDKLQREERAWKANSQLITAVSHDVRTPLTTLMGYLDILAESPELQPEDRQSYLEICRRKAMSLRELTDELFAYFLVLGTPEADAHLESMDGDLLLAQMLGEFSQELQQQGFIVEADLPPLGLTLSVDLQHMQRIFSNLLSNLCKYAGKSQSVKIQVRAVGNLLCISVKNSVKADAGKVESTRIGLQTCEKLASAMGGEFRKKQEKGTFTAELFLPATTSPA